jgi:hypothetical protein
MSQVIETTHLQRILDPVSRCLTPEVARQLVGLRAEPEIIERLETLAERSTEGELTAEERAEYETYVWAMDFIVVLQAQAQAALAGRNGT